MKTTLLRAGALSCALLASTALVTPAQAQTPPPPPRFNQVDGNGVDLVNGDYFFSMVEGSIGAGEGALTLVRNWAGAAGWTDNWSGKLRVGASEAIVEFGTYSDTFTNSSGTFTSTKGDGATLVAISGGYRYTARDGTRIDYRTDPVSGEQLLVFGCPSGTTCGIPTSMRRPSGMTYTMNYDFIQICLQVQDGACNHYGDSYRWRGVSNSANYAFTVNYATDDPGNGDTDPTAVAAWYRRSGAQFTNLDGAPSSLPTATYTAVSPTVTDITDTGGQTWRFTNNLSTGLVGIRRPGAGSDTTTISYASGMINSVTNEGVTTAYNFSTSGATRAVAVTDANSQATTVVSDLTKGRITSVTDPLSRVTGYTYDSDGRLTRVTAAEGNYVNYTYDARGNVTETRAVAKSGSGLNDMVSTASYASTCSNVVTCNQPNSTTDARGFQTDYTYDSGHGGVLSVTQPAASGSAPTGSGDRPETRYSYTQVTAVTGQPVYMLTGVSDCAYGTVASSCVGTTAESRQVIVYDTDNLRTTSVTARNGDNSLSATNAYTYDAIGNTLTVDGPLSGSADTTRYRYDAARRVIGVVGPDPDGGGSLKHRALRTTYTNGLPISVEQGNVNSQSDGDWASFSALQRVEQDYDGNARPTVQRLMSGSTTYQLTQTSYDGLGRTRCVAQRMNPSEFASLPSDACTLDTQGSYGPDRITRTSYDNAGQVTKVETGYGVTADVADEMTMTYRSNGQVETVADANGNLTTYVYDGHDRLSRTRMPHPSTTGTSSTTDYQELTYATATVGGNPVATPLVASVRTRDGNSIGVTYDNLGRLTAKDLPGSEPTVSYGYDLLNRLTSASTPSHSLGFTYDALGRQTTETNPAHTVTSTYDAAGRRLSVEANGHYYIGYSYLVTGEMSALLNSNSTPVYLFDYDQAGRRTTTTGFDSTSSTRSYDNIGRLTGLALDLPSTANDVTFGYTYNPAGEIASNSRSNDAFSFTSHSNSNVATSVNGRNQITAVGATSVSHDSNGNISSIGGVANYTYDSENRLTGAFGTTLSYDPLGRLYEVSNSSGTRRYLYDGGELFGEYNTSGSPLMFYGHGPGVDEPVMWFDYSALQFGSLHADERGSVVARVGPSGTSINRYDEYGNSQGALSGRFGYTGQVWMPEVGMYHYRARAYSPSLGRFLQTDPIGFEGGMNVYAYVGNNPLNFTDPFGLDASNCTTITTTWAHVVWVADPSGGYYPGKITDKWDVTDTFCSGDSGNSGEGGGGSNVVVTGVRPPKIKAFQPVDRCVARATPLLRAPAPSIVYRNRLMTIAAMKLLQHSWPLRLDGRLQSTFASYMNPEIIADLAGALIATRAAVPAGALNSRVTGDVGVIVGRDALSPLPVTTYMTVILGPAVPNPDGGLPERYPISIYPGC